LKIKEQGVFTWIPSQAGNDKKDIIPDPKKVKSVNNARDSYSLICNEERQN